MCPGLDDRQGPATTGSGGSRPWDDAEWGDVESLPLPNSRSGARQLTLRALYWESASPGQLEAALSELTTATSLSAEHVEFACQLARTASEHADELDALISSAITHWSLDRISRVDGLALRLALGELLYVDGIPARVTIHEAVELVKAYSGPRSFAFVNGVLDAIARSQGVEV
ncbi:MAG: transcription antitermination factor NusB [Candidatus Latescibacterota bacterium]|nr:transcription antitermination factor NusB [Candidatus Latescibacterota bacterium]